MIGSRLGPYELAALIGAGGMGEVYRARTTRLDSSVRRGRPDAGAAAAGGGARPSALA